MVLKIIWLFIKSEVKEYYGSSRVVFSQHCWRIRKYYNYSFRSVFHIISRLIFYYLIGIDVCTVWDEAFWSIWCWSTQASLWKEDNGTGGWEENSAGSVEIMQIYFDRKEKSTFLFCNWFMNAARERLSIGWSWKSCCQFWWTNTEIRGYPCPKTERTWSTGEEIFEFLWKFYFKFLRVKLEDILNCTNPLNSAS